MNQAPYQGGEQLREDVRGILGGFERIAARKPDDQPRYADGVRPWGTRDLRHCIETLKAALAALTPTPAPSDRGDDQRVREAFNLTEREEAEECATYLDGYADILSQAMYQGRRPSGIWQLERAARLLRFFATEQVASDRKSGEGVADRALALVHRIAAREPWQDHYGRTWEEEAAEIVAALPSIVEEG